MVSFVSLTIALTITRVRGQGKETVEVGVGLGKHGLHIFSPRKTGATLVNESV